MSYEVTGQPGVKLDDLKHASAYAEIVAIESLYNVVDRSDDAALGYAERNQLAYIPWFPLGHGQLTKPEGPLTPIARAFGLTASQLALAWLLHRSEATLLIPGTTSIAHLEENAKAADVKLTLSDVSEIVAMVDALKLETFRPTP